MELVIASDVDNPLLGITGATKIYGPQKGLPEERHVTVDGWLQRFAEVTDRKLAATKGAGAAGGLGFALLLLGGTRSSGVDLVAEAVGLAERCGTPTSWSPGKGRSTSPRAPARCRTAWRRWRRRQLVPCIALAGQVLVGSREMRALGVESAYSVVDLVGEERALGAPAEALADLASAPPAPGPADQHAEPGGVRRAAEPDHARNNRRCATIGPVATAPR